MKLTSLVIAKQNSWDKNSPYRATVKLESESSTVECVLSEDTMGRMLDLVAEEVAQNAARNMRDFVAAVNTIGAEKGAAMIGVI